MLSKKFQIALSAVLAFMGNYLGATAPLVKSIFLLVIIDVVLGMIASKYYRGIDLSTKRFIIKIREMGLFAVGLAAFIICDTAFISVGIASLWAAKFYCSAYAFYELFSIVENLGDMGFPVAANIKKMLKAKLDNNLIPTEIIKKDETNDKPKK